MMKLLKTKVSSIVLLVAGLLIFVPRLVLAQRFPNPIGYDNFMDFVEAILEVMLKIGIPVAAIFIVYSGLLFVKAQGNETELTKAKNAITYTIIGTAILLGSWLLAKGIESTIKSLG